MSPCVTAKRWPGPRIWAVLPSSGRFARLQLRKYFVEGDTEMFQLDDYTSHNTCRLDVEGVKRLC